MNVFPVALEAVEIILVIRAGESLEVWVDLNMTSSWTEFSFCNLAHTFSIVYFFLTDCKAGGDLRIETQWKMSWKGTVQSSGGLTLAYWNQAKCKTQISLS